jgi:hypothetical protein
LRPKAEVLEPYSMRELEFSAQEVEPVLEQRIGS